MPKLNFLKFIKAATILVADYAYDLKRFRRFSAFGKRPIADSRFLQARLMINAHGIEKGLSLKGFEPGRGIGKVRAAEELLTQYRQATDGKSDTATGIAEDALANYAAKQTEFGMEGNGRTEGITGPVAAQETSSVRSLTVDALTVQEREALAKGLRTRASIREYSDRPITNQEVQACVIDALSTPSVCNRQGFRVHYSLKPEIIKAALTVQNGNNGFGQAVPGLFIVTCSLTIFSSSSERNQAFVDGGLFAMSLMLSLHAHGLGSCPLNWSASYRQDKMLRRIVNLPEDEVVIMMISFGHLANKFTAAGSRRYPLAHFMREIVKS